MPIIILQKSKYFFALSLVFLLVACIDKETLSHSIQVQIAEQYGVSIKKILDISDLPDSTLIKIQQNLVDVQLTPASEKQITRYIPIIKTALEKYPVSVVKKHLRKIFIGGPFSENGGVVAGMYEKDKLYLFYNAVQGYTSDVFLEQTIHHEFSSILIYFYDFPAFDWLDLNPKDLDYIINLSEINDYMNTINSYSASETQLQQGLVSSYGQVNAENDINSYVELIFTQPEIMKTYIKKYPRIGPKYEMIKNFYLSISPDFRGAFDKIR